MKSDEDVRMISAEAPVLFARACEFFIQELTIRSWSAAQEFKRRTLQRSDVATAITRTGGWCLCGKRAVVPPKCTKPHSSMLLGLSCHLTSMNHLAPCFSRHL